jgi:hypothetical protein
MDWDRRPARAPQVLSERLDDEVLLYVPAVTKTIRLNEAASLIWDLCNGQHSARAIAALLSEAYPGDDHRIEADVETTLGMFLADGAIELL